ncbi:unnamed protein product [Urochloa humidicola]
MCAAKWEQRMATATSEEVRRPADGSFSRDDAVVDIKPGGLCLETRYEEDTEDGCMPLDGSTNFELNSSRTGICEHLLDTSVEHITDTNFDPAATLAENESSEDRPWIEQQLSSFIVDFSTRQVNRRSLKKTWACLSLSSIDAPVRLRFLSNLRNTCVDIGMDFKKMPTLNAELNYSPLTGIEKALYDAYELIKKLLDGRWLGLLIVILPDDRCYDEKVQDVCKKLGVTYHCCLPEDASVLREEYLDRAAREINAKAKEDCDSTELSDLEEYCDSSSDEEVSSDSDSNELQSSCGEMYGFEQFDGWGERDTFSEETSESQTFKLLDDKCEGLLNEEGGSHMAYKKRPYIPCDEVSKSFGTDGYYRLRSSRTEKEKDLASANDGFFVEHKADMTSDIPASHVLDEYSNYQTLKENEVQVERGIVMYWACFSLSRMNDGQLLGFLHKLQTKLTAIGMHFSSLPARISRVKSAVPADIENTLLDVRDSISKLGMKEHISLLLVILPEDRDFDAKVEEVCKNLGVGYQCCLPCLVRRPSKQYLKETAHKIKFKVVKQQALIPFVSEAPTILLGADMSSCIREGSKIVSVAASTHWPKVSRYLVVSCLEENYGSMISKLLLNCNTATKEAPQRMILFRYGITEGSAQILREISSINMGCHSSSNHKPTLTYVIVTERLNMESEGRNEMTPDGTTVQGISYLTKFEVLCNHGPFKGIRMPVSYRVVHDDNNLTPGELKSIIIQLSLLRDHDRYPEISMVPPAHCARIYRARTDASPVL